jgi:hypothetical protein
MKIDNELRELAKIELTPKTELNNEILKQIKKRETKELSRLTVLSFLAIIIVNVLTAIIGYCTFYLLLPNVSQVYNLLLIGITVVTEFVLVIVFRQEVSTFINKILGEIEYEKKYF